MNNRREILLLVIFVFSFSLNANKIYAQSEITPFRGFMIDAPRTTESLSYYFKLIDFCEQHGLNTIIFRLTDDEGSAYKFSSHPELVMCAGAYSKEELKQLVKYAQGRNIEIIPEIETFGHAKYIVQSPKYRHLNDAIDDSKLNAVCPVNDSTLLLMKDLFTEVASVFPSKYFHIGCDETFWGGSELTKKALQTKSKNQIWSKYVNTLNSYVKQLGKQTIIWGDIPVYNENEVLDSLSKDIIIAEWNYWENDAAVVNRVAQKIIKKGFKIIGCPAVSWCKWGARIGKEQFKNISAYASVYTNLNTSGNLGIILTNWVPQKYVQYSQWDSYAIAAKIVQDKGTYHFGDAMAMLAENMFGAKNDSVWMRIFNIIYTAAPLSNCADADSIKLIPWSDSAQVKSLIQKRSLLNNPFKEAKKMLLKKRNAVKINKEVFEDIVITVDFMNYLFDRQNAIFLFANRDNTDLKTAAIFLSKVAAEDNKYRAIIKAAWLMGRRAMTDEYDKDYFYSFTTAADFSKRMAENPSVFLEIIEKK